MLLICEGCTMMSTNPFIGVNLVTPGVQQQSIKTTYNSQNKESGKCGKHWKIEQPTKDTREASLWWQPWQLQSQE